MTESNIWKQLKKGQGETNQRLEELIALQRETNRLLDMLVRQQSPSPTPRA